MKLNLKSLYLIKGFHKNCYQREELLIEIRDDLFKYANKTIEVIISNITIHTASTQKIYTIAILKP